MKQIRKPIPWESCLLRHQERLRLAYYWYPYPALISIGLVFILSGHIMPGLNPRLGSMADTIRLDSKRQKEGSIWLGLYPSHGQVIATTSDRKSFSWPQDIKSDRDIQHLITYLKDRVKKESIATGLSLETSITKISAILAVDQRLNYGQLRPVIQALAEARISKYGFETRIVR